MVEDMVFLGMIMALLIHEQVKEGGIELDIVLVVAIKMTMA